MTEQALGIGLGFFTCEVRDIRDPDKAGKVKVIVHGHHNVGDVPIQDEDLPWAYPVMNNTPSLNRIGSSVNYLPGSTLIGFWLDPETKQIPCILGSMHRAGYTQSSDPKNPEPDGSIDGTKKSTPVNPDNLGDPGNSKANQKNNTADLVSKSGTDYGKSNLNGFG